MRSPNIEYCQSLDHLRLFACLLVLLYLTFHPTYCFLTNSANGTSQTLPIDPFSIFIIEGHTGIGLFLILSGFLFARISKEGTLKIKNFYLNRILRIYPLFVFILLLAIFFWYAPAPLPAFFCSLLTLQNTPLAVHTSQLEHLWTLSVELQFYLVFPYLLWLLKKDKGMQLLSLCLVTDILALAVMYFFNGQVFHKCLRHHARKNK